MEVSYFFESIRTAFLDKFFLIITEFGGESLTYIFLFIAIWCTDAEFSRFFVIVNFYSLGTNIFLKNIFCIPRPWVKNPNFTVVDQAIEDATGYSFPSGHTANALSIFGSFAIWAKNIYLRVILFLFIILISISRIYLGVHTLLDVITSLVLGIIIILSIKLYVRYSKAKDTFLNLIVFACIYSIIIVLTLYLVPKTSNYDPSLSFEGLKNAYTILGLSFGYLLSYIIDIKYNTKASYIIQFFKVLLGAVFVLIIKEGSKYLFDLWLPHMAFTNAIRYFLIVIFAIMIWPMTFKWFHNIELKIWRLKNAKS